jgi:hypothetical protein
MIGKSSGTIRLTLLDRSATIGFCVPRHFFGENSILTPIERRRAREQALLQGIPSERLVLSDRDRINAISPGWLRSWNANGAFYSSVG